MSRAINLVALAGGVGGAKLADGLARTLPPASLTVVVNTGDDFEHFGLRICPDLDTVCYTLAGLANPQTGWGRAEESWRAMEAVAQLGGPTWFRLGDRDLGTHLERTRRLEAGERLTQITRDFCRAWGIEVTVLPMSDAALSTRVITAEGELPFQEYFVQRRCQPHVRGFRLAGLKAAQPAPEVLASLHEAEAVIICPSNPWVSIDPILALPGIIPTLEGKPVVAVSPLIGGKAVKGPAAKMFQELGVEPSALAVAQHYQRFLTGFVLDRVDADQSEAVRALGVTPLVTDILMRTVPDRARLAREVVDFTRRLLGETPATGEVPGTSLVGYGLEEGKDNG